MPYPDGTEGSSSSSGPPGLLPGKREYQVTAAKVVVDGRGHLFAVRAPVQRDQVSMIAYGSRYGSSLSRETLRR